MNELKKTLGFAAAAAALVGLALVTAPRRPSAAVFSEVGGKFYPGFDSPDKATSLEVVEFDEAWTAVQRFKVEFRNARWTIPSHHGYPADARERLSKTAGAVIGLVKDDIRSENAEHHEAYGVVDPEDTKVAATKGRGKRVTLRDVNGQVLADFIFGKEVREGSGMKYVRLPGQKRVYSTKTKAEISARFSDWIETDLLKLSTPSVRKIVIDDYRIRFDGPEGGRIIDRATHHLARDDGAAPWKIGGLKENEEVNAEKVGEMLTALGELKIAGVRPKPPVLTRDLRLSGDVEVKKRMTMEQQLALQSLPQKGYYFLPDGTLVSNEGELQVSGDDGAVYTLRFGDVLVGEGAAVSSGAEDPKKDPKEKKGSENRYLMVTARFDEALLGAPPAEPKAYVADPAKKPEEQKAEEEKAKKEKEEHDRKKKDHDKKIEDGKKRVQELTDRFAEWYYVISADVFKKLRKTRTDVVKPKEAPKPPEGTKPDEKKPPEEKKPDEKKPPEEKKPEAPKPPEEKKPAEEKKPEEKPK